MNPNPKVSKKIPLAWNKKQRVYSKNLGEGGPIKQKGRTLGKTSRKDTKSHLDIT
jgi:hypothetical protein